MPPRFRTLSRRTIPQNASIIQGGLGALPSNSQTQPVSPTPRPATTGMSPDETRLRQLLGPGPNAGAPAAGPAGGVLARPRGQAWMTGQAGGNRGQQIFNNALGPGSDFAGSGGAQATFPGVTPGGMGRAAQGQQQGTPGFSEAATSAMTREGALLMQFLSDQENLGQQQGQFDEASNILLGGAEQAGEGVDIGGFMGEAGLPDTFWQAQRDLSTDRSDRQLEATIQREKETAVANGWFGTQMWKQRVAELQGESEQTRNQGLAGIRQEQAGMLREDRLNRAQLEVQQATGLGGQRAGLLGQAADLVSRRPSEATNFTGAYDWLQGGDDAMQLMNPDGSMRALSAIDQARLLADVQRGTQAEARGEANDFEQFWREQMGFDPEVGGVPAFPGDRWNLAGRNFGQQPAVGR